MTCAAGAASAEAPAADTTEEDAHLTDGTVAEQRSRGPATSTAPASDSTDALPNHDLHTQRDSADGLFHQSADDQIPDHSLPNGLQGRQLPTTLEGEDDLDRFETVLNQVQVLPLQQSYVAVLHVDRCCVCACTSHSCHSCKCLMLQR